MAFGLRGEAYSGPCLAASLFAEKHFEVGFSNYTAADQAYLLHFYPTGDKGEFKTFWREGALPIHSKLIPDFKPKKRVFRMDGVAI